MRFLALLIALALSATASAALPGVTEFGTSPEEITDGELAALLDTRIAKAQVVALGETVHGSSRLLAVQTRLVRYLVSRHGFRLIVWENPTLRSLELSRWLASCTARRSEPPIDVLYMPTPSDLALWRWACEFNRSSPEDPIVFRGMDVWDRPWEHYERVQALGPRAGIAPLTLKTIAMRCPAREASSWSDVEVVLARVQSEGRFVPEGDYEQCRSALATLIDTPARSSAAGRRTSDAVADDAFELAISASTLLGWLGFYNFNWSDDVLSWNARDLAQGTNLMLVMQKHGARRAIVSAHTSHTSHSRSPADWWGYGDLKSGIHFFAALTSKPVFNIALTAYEASGTQGTWSLPTARNSLDGKLHDAGHAFSFFASDAAFLAEHPKWWMQNQNYPGRYESGVEIAPREHFDAFIFVDRSHLDEALPARPMWEP